MLKLKFRRVISHLSQIPGFRTFFKFFVFLLLIKKVREDFNYIQKRNQGSKKKYFLDNQVAYLRTTFWVRKQSFGGEVAHSKGVIEGFHKKGLDIHIYSIGEMDFLRDHIPSTIISPDIFSYDFEEIQELEYNRYFIKRVTPLIEQNKPSFIYQRYGLNSYTGAYISQLFDLPFILEYNGSEIWMGEHWVSKLKYRRIAERIELLNFEIADIVVANASSLKDELIERGVEPEKILFIPNGVDEERFKPSIEGSDIRRKYGLSEETVLVGFIGSFGAWHGADVLARSVIHIIKQYHDIHFFFIGDGKNKSRTEDIIKYDQVENHVTFIGSVSQLEAPEYLAACNILVSPQIPNPDGTAFFGSPTKLFEYMALGKCIVASNLDQIGQILKDKETAILVKPNDVEDLARGILISAEDSDLRIQMGRKVRQVALKQYTWEKHVEQILEMINKFKDKRK